MLNPLRLLPSTMRRGALVLAFACTFGNPALAHAAAASGALVVTGVRAGVEGTLTRITIAGSAPLAYGVRRADAATLLVELPGADATHLAWRLSTQTGGACNAPVMRMDNRSRVCVSRCSRLCANALT